MKKTLLLLLPFLIWLSNFFYDDLFFVKDRNMILYAIIKVIYILLLYLSEYGLLWIIKGIKEKKPEARICLISFVGIFLFYIIWLIFAYPGGWGWDGYTILEYTKNYDINYWTGLLTSIEYFLALMIFPSPVSVVILQIYLAALIIARICLIFYKLMGKENLVFFVLIPFVLPISISYVLCPIRAILFALLSLEVCMEFISINRGEVSLLQLCVFSGLLSLSAFWRSEGCMFILLIPCVVINIWNKISKRVVLEFLSISVIMLVVMKSVTISNYQYMITSLYYPIQHMVQSNEVDYEGVSEDLEKIDRVFNVEVMKQSYSDPKGGFSQEGFAYGKEGFHPENATVEDYHEMLEGFCRMVLHKPLLFAKVRIQTFLGSMQQGDFGVASIRNFDKEVGSSFGLENYLFFERWNVDVQRKIVGFLSYKFGKVSIDILRRTINNMLYPIIVICGAFVYCVIKRKWDIAMVTFCYIGITCGTIVFEPLGQPMYYLHQYIFGYVLLVWGILDVYKLKRRHRI